MSDGPLSIENRQELLRVPRARIERAVRAAFRLRGRRRLPPLSVAVVDDREIRRLHRDFLGADHATDVISFPLQDEMSLDPEPCFGEVVASAETALREAKRRGHPPTFELTLYVVHGVLHLLGCDDHRPKDRAAMREAERRCLKAAGIPRDLCVD